MWTRVWFAGACLAGSLLSACAVIDPVDSRYDTVSRSLAKARNESILLNLVRASQDYPLSFVTVGNVTPTLTNTTNLGLPSFLLGPGAVSGNANSLFTPGRDVIFGNNVASNTTAVSTNFSVSTQETTSFYQGFLKPIDLQILDYFIRQGYSRELLFWLFADSVEISLPGGHSAIGTRYNPPNDYGCEPQDPRKRCFSDFILVAVAAGLTVEQQTLQKPIGGGGDGGGVQKSGDTSSSGSKTETIVVPRFCFSDVLQRQARIAMGELLWDKVTKQFFDKPIALFTPKCGDPSWNPANDYGKWQPDTFNFYVGPLKFKIVPRSAYGVFEFLGNLIKMQLEHPQPVGWIPPGRPAEEITEQPPTLKTAPMNSDNQLIVVTTKTAGGFCFVHTWFFNGDYCVPENATNTKRIFSLLAQLIAITTNATDLSITPLVRIVQ
jgi:hypothetical protein